MADDPGMETMLPLLLERYRIEGMLGEGGLGTVVKGFDTRLKRMVAIKTLKRTSYASDPELFRALEERFAREAEAGSRMGVHPNLVTVYDLFVDTERTQYLFLEYVPGGTLADRIKQRPVPLADALRLTADVARGLMAAHNAGIVHRDIKPANIFIGEDGRAQVGDFGIAQIDDISGRTHTTASHPGTPLYMSPEQAHSTGYVRPSSDQYSLGLVLFELLTGQAYKRLEKHEADALLAQQSTTVAALVTRMLAPEPGDRYPGMTGVLTAIQAIAAMPAQVSSTNTPTLPAPTLDDAVTKHQTPALNLQPVPPVLDRPPPPPADTAASRSFFRPVAIGIGGLSLVAVAIIAVLFVVRGNSTKTATVAPSPAITSAGTTNPLRTIVASATTQATSQTTIATTSANTVTTPGAPVATAAASTTVGGPPPLTSALAYLDGRVALPGETRDNVNGKNIFVGDPVQVVGVDLSRLQPLNLPDVALPGGGRVVRSIWAPQGPHLATLVREPIPGGFSENLDLEVIDITTGKTATVAKAINTLPAWSPDGTMLVYGLLAGKRPPPPEAGYSTPIDSYDVHLVGLDGKNDRVIGNAVPYHGGCGAGGNLDPIQEFVRADQFILQRGSAAWAADNSRIALYLGVDIFTLRPDGSELRLFRSECGETYSVDLGTIIGTTTDDPYIPANGMQIRMADDADALQWRYEHGLVPTTVISGCEKSQTSEICDNSKKGSANSGYRNQIVARFPDGTERKLTNSPTFKYHATPSPDGTAVAFTGITVTDYGSAAANVYKFFTGYRIDVYIIRISGGSETKISTTGTAHHPSWQRDSPVKAIARATEMPPTPTPPPSIPTTRPSNGTQLTTWTDPEGRMRLQYPSSWRATRDNSTGNILELDSPDGVFLYINVFNPDRPAAEGLQGFQNRQRSSTMRNYTQGSIQSVRVGGAPGAFMTYKSVNKSGAQDPHTGEVWYVDGGGKQYVIEVYTTGTSLRRTDEINALISSIVFLR